VDRIKATSTDDGCASEKPVADAKSANKTVIYYKLY
jgi:hypothetical protein